MIDFNNVSKDAKIVVAMSGGVDSSTAVALLKEAGYKNVIGMTLILYENNSDKGIVCKDQTIIDDCTRVAKKLNIEHHFVELKEKFMEEIINPFIDGYLNGITINPCINCNRDIKFGALLQESMKINADVLVTGHYIKWCSGKNGEGEIYAGNELRDQSYFLSQVRKDVLKYLRFPLANFSKIQTRAAAEKFELHVSNKKSSSDLCFVSGESYSTLMKKSTQKAIHGNIISLDGTILGKHEGIHHFTVGQRKGIGVSGQNEPYFVVGINRETGDVSVGPREALAKKEIMLSKVNWLGDEPFSFNSKNIKAKVRASQVLIDAVIEPIDAENAKITFSEDVFGVAKGQICAFYDNNRLLGGGYI